MSVARDPRLFLDDMLAATGELALIVAEGEEAFMQHSRTRLAVERLIEIIGEAAAQLPVEVRTNHPEVPWRALTDMRNRLIHGYHSVDANRVWAAISNGIPDLQIQLKVVLDALDKAP